MMPPLPFARPLISPALPARYDDVWRSASVRLASDGVGVDCIHDAAEFAALGPKWNELLQASGSDAPFLTWEWLHAWWTHLRGRSALRLIAVRARGELLALAPFRLVPAPLSWFSRLELLGTGDAGSDYLDVIVRRGAEAESLSALAAAVQSLNLPVRLSHLPPGSAGEQLAARLTRDDRWAAVCADDGVCPIVRLEGHTFESLLSILGSSHRANVRRRLRALERRFAVRFERVSTHAQRRDALAALTAFHASRYARRGGSTAFRADAARRFHDDATSRALDRGWLRMYLLRLDEHLAGVMYGLHYAGRFYFYQHGYSPAYAAHSVGLALMAMTIRAAIREGTTEFDMLWGAEPYKFLWARGQRVLRRADLFPAHLGGRVHRRAFDARRGMSHIARRLLGPGPSGGSGAA